MSSSYMNRQILKRARRRLFTEKTFVELAGLVGVAAVFLLVGPMLIGEDPLGATTFAFGGVGRVVVAALAMIVVAMVCGVLTVVARPAAAGAATLIGLMGLSLGSPPLRTLLWKHHGDLPSLYWMLVVELLVGAVLVVGAIIVGSCVRRFVMGRAGRWAWRNPLADADVQPSEWPHEEFSLVAYCKGLVGSKRLAMCAAIMVIGGAVLVTVLCRTGERKQVLFSLFMGFMLTALIAHQIFPMVGSAVFWAGPIVVGLLVYALAASASQALGDLATGWTDVPHLARALPVDWLTVGSGGGLIGYLISARMHEGKILDHLEELAGEDE
jgi:hypothetical protein